MVIGGADQIAMETGWMMRGLRVYVCAAARLSRLRALFVWQRQVEQSDRAWRGMPQRHALTEGLDALGKCQMGQERWTNPSAAAC